MEEKVTPAQWRRRAEKAESRYLKLREEIEQIRAKDMGNVIELCEHRYRTEQVRKLLVEAVSLIDDISESEAESERLFRLAMERKDA
jgi:hypothetical protein